MDIGWVCSREVTGAFGTVNGDRGGWGRINGITTLRMVVTGPDGTLSTDIQRKSQVNYAKKSTDM